MKLSMIWTLCALAVIIIILDTAKAEANRRPKQRPQSHRRPRPHRKPHNKHRPRRPHKGPQTHHLVYTSEALDELYGGNGPTGDITSNYSPQTQSDIVEDDFKVPNFFNDIRQQYYPTEHQQPQTYNKPETSYKQPNTSYKQPETSYKQPETSYKQPETSYKQPGTSYKQPETSYKQPETSYKQPETSYKQPETSYKQPETSYKQPETIYKQPQTSYKQPETSYKQPETSYKQPEKSYKQPETSYKQPETSYKQPETSYKQTEISYKQPETSYKQPETSHKQPETSYKQPETSYKQPETSYKQPETIYKQPQTSFKQPETSYKQPETSYKQPETSYKQPETSYKQPETSYKQPETSYKQPEKSYKQPETSYKQPETSYKQPETSYKQPETSYKQPETSYKQQETSYKQPETSYKQPETSYKQPETSYKQPETSYKQPDTSYKQPETSYKQPETSYKSPNKVNTYGSNSADSQSDYRKNGVLYKDDTAPTQSEDSAYNEPATGDMFDFSFPTFESLKTSFINKMRELQTSHGYTGTIDNSEARPIDAGIVDDHSSTASQVHETVSTVAATPPPTYRAASASHLVQISVHGGVFQSTPATTPHYQSEGDNSPLLELSSTVYENQQRQSAEFPTDRDRHVIHTDVGEKQGEARDYLDQSVFPTNQHPVDMQLNSNHTITATAISSHRRRDDMKSHRVNASRVYEHQLRSHSNIDDSNDRYDTASGMSNENSIILAPSSSLGTPGRTSDADTETISVQATDASIFRNKYPPHNDNYYPPTYSPHTVTASSRRHEGNSLVSASEGVSEGAAVVTHPRSSLLSVYSTPPRSLYADYPDYDTPKPSSIRRQP